MHWKILKHYDIKAIDKWYEHQAKTVTKNEKVTILWDMQVHTVKMIKANKPDIIIKDQQEKNMRADRYDNPLQPKDISKSSREIVLV